MVHTKLHIPHVRKSLVARPRLIHKLNEGRDAKLTLVSAQAGYGKTTVLSEWVKQCDSDVAWVSLDSLDNDWIQFWSYVTASIQERVPGFGLAVQSLLDSGPSISSEPAITELLNELNGFPHDLVIILDDYHVIELPSIHRSMIYLLEHLPPHIHLYIASRTDLSIPTARLLAKGELHQIKMQDLRFQLDEGLVFFRETTDLGLSPEQVKMLFQQTEGWISGLQLAALSLKQSDNITDSLQQFSGHQHNISDYLLQEVFHHQPEQTRAFLLHTSILSRMNASLCQAVTGQINGQAQLERLEQMNLFIVPLDDHRKWYRYHHLLSDFLQQLLHRADPDLWVQVHIRAAEWLESQGFDEEAVEHYLEGKQFSDAVRLIEKNLHKLVQTKSVVLIRWVSVLPADSFAEKPMIELFYISVLLGVGEWTAAFHRVKQATIRFQALEGKVTDAAWKQAMGNIYFFNAITSYLQKDLERTSDYFGLVEQYMPEGSFFQTVGRNRYQGFDSFDDLLGHINDLHTADAFLLKWITVWHNKQEYPFLGFLCASYSKLLYEWNRLEEAEMYAAMVLGRQDMHPFARIMMQIHISASRIQQAKGNLSRATALLTELKLLINSPDYELFMLRIEAEQACLSLRQGSLQEAEDWLQRCGMAHLDEVSLNRAAEYLAYARVLVACERMDEALNLLERLNRMLDKKDRLRDRIQVIILHSMALKRSGQTEAALLQLETALHLAEPEGYIRSFIDEGPVMAELLSVYGKRLQGSYLGGAQLVTFGYVQQLLQAMQVTSQDSFQIEQPRKEILTDQETKVLVLIARGLTNKQIASDLHITGETVKFHIRNVYRKLEANNRVHALQRAKELRILV
ncbi:LuxR C-terminal-related transcriptional regulator [Paenibacillus sp. sgz5001063]|uniref:LuxR C-terminal-related transcriptional regulator n=1 Tax=Paenibacillus sp. sgz5001063 TaxID=3242474 RepID=UPI0036D2B88E